MHQEALRRAIDLCDGQAGLARKINVKQGHVWFWLNKAKKLPPEIAMDIEKATEGKVRRWELRPDVWQSEPAEAT